MPITTDPVLIVGTGQTPYLRHPSPVVTTAGLLAKAAAEALAQSGLSRGDIDGLAVSSFTLAPDRAIDLAVKLGLRLRWIMDSGLGGASGIDMVQHARRAIESGDARNVLIVAGDRFNDDDFIDLVEHYNSSMEEDFEGLQGVGPNAIFALVTRLQMNKFGLTKADYGSLVCAQREWAARNPNAAYRSSLTLDDYLAAPLVADPLTTFDCVPVVAGANALVLATDREAAVMGILVLEVTASHNHDLHESDGLQTGLAVAAAELWQHCGLGPSDIDVMSLYDDYPAVVVAQLIDAGFIGGSDAAAGLRSLLTSGRILLNTSGGQLSAGQCGAGGGLHGVVEVARALAGQGQPLPFRARRGLVAGYGMLAYRYGACSNAALLEVS